MIKYALGFFVFCAIVGGAYFAGYNVGSANTRVEYVEKEIIKYVEVEKKRAEIYSAPDRNRDSILGLYEEGSL